MISPLDDKIAGRGSSPQKAARISPLDDKIAGRGSSPQKAARISPLDDKIAGRGSVWLERSVRDAEVTGSSPVAPTFYDKDQKNNQQEFPALWMGD